MAISDEEAKLLQLDHAIIVAILAREIEDMIHEFTREHGEVLKVMGVNPKEAQMRSPRLFEECITVLRAKMLDAKTQQEKKQ